MSANSFHVFSSVDSLVDMFYATIVSQLNCFEVKLNYYSFQIHVNYPTG